jgi:hypothetical protein
LYEVEYFGDGLYAIDEGNGLTLMLPRTSKKFAEAIAQALQAAYAKGQKDKEDEVNAVLQDAGIDYPLGVRGLKDLVQQRDGYIDALNEGV